MIVSLTESFDCLMIVADWNIGFGCTCDFTTVVSLFIDDSSLVVVDLDCKERVGFLGSQLAL